MFPFISWPDDDDDDDASRGTPPGEHRPFTEPSAVLVGSLLLLLRQLLLLLLLLMLLSFLLLLLRWWISLQHCLLLLSDVRGRDLKFASSSLFRLPFLRAPQEPTSQEMARRDSIPLGIATQCHWLPPLNATRHRHQMPLNTTTTKCWTAALEPKLMALSCEIRWRFWCNVS